MFPLSTPFLLTKPGERMVMYLCARDINVSSFYTFSIDQARRENDQCICVLEISMFPLSTPFSIDQDRRENDHVFVF